MKFLLLSALVLSLPRLARAESDVSCIANVRFSDGLVMDYVVECDSEYANKCFKEIEVDGKFDWEEVSCE